MRRRDWTSVSVNSAGQLGMTKVTTRQQVPRYLLKQLKFKGKDSWFESGVLNSVLEKRIRARNRLPLRGANRPSPTHITPICLKRVTRPQAFDRFRRSIDSLRGMGGHVGNTLTRQCPSCGLRTEHALRRPVPTTGTTGRCHGRCAAASGSAKCESCQHKFETIEIDANAFHATFVRSTPCSGRSEMLFSRTRSTRFWRVVCDPDHG
jgi:hypothetical protein